MNLLGFQELNRRGKPARLGLIPRKVLSPLAANLDACHIIHACGVFPKEHWLPRGWHGEANIRSPEIQTSSGKVWHELGACWSHQHVLILGKPRKAPYGWHPQAQPISHTREAKHWARHCGQQGGRGLGVLRLP